MNSAPCYIVQSGEVVEAVRVAWLLTIAAIVVARFDYWRVEYRIRRFVRRRRLRRIRQARAAA